MKIKEIIYKPKEKSLLIKFKNGDMKGYHGNCAKEKYNRLNDENYGKKDSKSK